MNIFLLLHIFHVLNHGRIKGGVSDREISTADNAPGNVFCVCLFVYVCVFMCLFHLRRSPASANPPLN